MGGEGEAFLAPTHVLYVASMALHRDVPCMACKCRKCRCGKRLSLETHVLTVICV